MFFEGHPGLVVPHNVGKRAFEVFDDVVEFSRVLHDDV